MKKLNKMKNDVFSCTGKTKFQFSVVESVRVRVAASIFDGLFNLVHVLHNLFPLLKRETDALFARLSLAFVVQVELSDNDF